MARRLIGSGLVRFTFVLCIALAGVALAQANDEDAIVELGETWEMRYNDGDTRGVGALYTEDALYVTSTGTVVEGPDQIAGLLQAFIDAGFETTGLELDKLRVLGDVAYGFGRWVLTHTEGPTIEGHFTLVVVRTADGWRYDHNANSAIEAAEE